MLNLKIEGVVDLNSVGMAFAICLPGMVQYRDVLHKFVFLIFCYTNLLLTIIFSLSVKNYNTACQL